MQLVNTVESGDLFGALVKRKFHAKSNIYQNGELFGLSLPCLNEHAPDIFNSSVQDALCMSEQGVQEQKTSSCVQKPLPHVSIALPVLHSFPSDVCSQLGLIQPNTLPKYFSMCSANSFTRATHRVGLIYLSELDITKTLLIALKGIPSELIRLDRLPAMVAIPGRTSATISRFLSDSRFYFVLRCLIDAAVSGFLRHCEDVCSQAMGMQLASLLHVFDSSVTVIYTEINDSHRDSTRCSLVALWECTQLHRTLLLHIFSLIHPADLTIHKGTLSSFTTANNGLEFSIIAKYLCDLSWRQPEGWGRLHKLVGLLECIRRSVWESRARPVFQHALFVNTSDFSFQRRNGCGDVGSAYARMVLTGSVVLQVSEPLLREVVQKLYHLDADFHRASTVADNELAESLLISIDAVWKASDMDGGGECRADCMVEFLLAALAWSRGRVELMLLDQSDCDERKGQQVGIAPSKTKRVLDVPIRSDAPNRVPRPLTQLSGGSGRPGHAADLHFDRKHVVASFRSICPDLIIPMNAADEAALARVRSQTEHVARGLGAAVQRTVAEWYKVYATMSDYYDEHAVAAESMFADVDYHIRPPPRLESLNVPPEPDPSKLRATAAPPEADVASALISSDSAAKGVDDVTIITEPLNAVRTVPRAMMEAAEQRIRAKYEGLMHAVEGRNFATSWRKRQLQRVKQNRIELTALFAQDEREWEGLRLAKERDHAAYIKHFEDLKLSSSGKGSVRATAVQDLLTDEDESKRSNVTELQEVFTDTNTEEAKLSEGRAEDAPGVAMEHARDSAIKPPPSEDSVGALSTCPRLEDLETVAVLHDTGDSEHAAHGDATDVLPGSAVGAIASEDSPTAGCIFYEHAATLKEDSEESKEGEVGAEILQGPAPSSHSMADIAQPLLYPDESYTQAEGVVFDAIGTLSHAIVRLGISTGQLSISAEGVHRLLESELQARSNGLPFDLLQAVVQMSGRVDCPLHSLHAIFVHSLGQTVLAQCRAINIAALHCLVSSATDLLGHISAVDNMLLVSPNSDFIMSLCTIMVDQHMKSLRVLRRQSNAPTASLAHQFTDLRHAALWNDDAVCVGFPCALTSASDANAWKELGSRYASLHMSRGQDDHVLSNEMTSARLAELWGGGLYSVEGLETLRFSYNAPWPIPAIISVQVLEQFTQITRRFLELGQLVALFRVCWGELRLGRVGRSDPTCRSMSRGTHSTKRKARPTDSTNTQPLKSRAERLAERLVERRVADAMRLVQQCVQALFDFLSERVYVHQAQFKRAVRLAANEGIDRVTLALHHYSKALAGSALQLTSLECAAVSSDELQSPGSFMSEDPLIAMKLSLNDMLQNCRCVLGASMQLNDLQCLSSSREYEGLEGELLGEVSAHCRRVQDSRALVVAAAKKLINDIPNDSELQSLVMRFEQ